MHALNSLTDTLRASAESGHAIMTNERPISPVETRIAMRELDATIKALREAMIVLMTNVSMPKLDKEERAVVEAATKALRTIRT